ncbi:hypothetical protein [Stagnihabitans tardus]|uniref:Uncharacterized protein n=1 Tax=Stagnihabitans tardus TaxID=2699202 RepID=A0AAE4YDH3_9RHOB|nr:hypothetical protein [Stagnihabitans tardus]NBZ90069.1 hypothetical protein [Stagnihabitans tardus]
MFRAHEKKGKNAVRPSVPLLYSPYLAMTAAGPRTAMGGPFSNLKVNFLPKVHQVYLKFITICDSDLASSRANKLINLEANLPLMNYRSSLATTVAGAASFGESSLRRGYFRLDGTAVSWDNPPGLLGPSGTNTAVRHLNEYECEKVNRALTFSRVTQLQEDL